MKLLLIDTSNRPMSIALTSDDEVLAELTTDSKQDHSSQLMPGIKSLFDQVSINKREIDGIVVAKGPGSYTGVRIGVTTAKTLAYALETDLYGVSSLKALAATIENKDDRLLVPIFDARRDAVYTGVYRYIDGQLTTILEDQYLSLDDLHVKLADLNQPYIYIGQDATKLADKLNGHIVDHLPQAQVMKGLITQPENVHVFVPNYIKLSEAERNWLNQQNQN
ncbi:tRNA (adenosine(37)-N6)-threonylcarbamoyltransferase complex dimerization subunit type 1 TsaB [Staphylococcus devriesei]|uniref:tRNA (adenosine(37)-N6)-threonylcarbamoyltransferase complex dimerization subunit type 1 TsaB n=1 Tax=Staphylococcus devriesei TaxID=586733 RepID=UPI000E69CBD2|nr:tRNA (adenosine(37)-N6)-threonylcarbamoyltransferase complex dimerization subunit type 1 TsaB [Staphylococcus devriesei]RIL71212.1 tRNA (adenosine(37)-N6)-threonylcarbamoyltransferase complex dimerization subunit type 1 TsaB [Staphylococcus devriesei]